MRLNLKTKSALFVGLSVLLLVVGVGTWRERQMRLDYVKSFQEQQKLLADTKAEGVADSIELLRGIVETTGLGFDEATFADSGAQRRFFERVANAKAIFSGFSIITAEGSVVASEPARPASAPLSVADRDYFKQVLATGRVVISEPIVSRTSNQPAVIIAAPLRNAQGHVVGVFAAGIQLLRLNVLSQVSRDTTGFGGFFALTTRGDPAVYLVHPDASNTLRPVAASEVDSASGDALLRISNSTNIAIRTRSAVRLTNWDLNAVLISGEAFSGVQLASQRLLASYAYLGAAAGLLAWVSTALLLRPLSRLNDAVEAARVSASGELRTTVIHRDEIGDLTLSFDRLLAQLRTQQAELNAAQNASPLGLFRCGVDGNVIYANDAYRDILGLDRKQSLDDWLAMVPADRRERISSDWRRGASSAAPNGGLLRLRRSDGSTLRVSVKTAPIIVGGLHVGNACTLEDVTERERNAKAQRMLLAVFDATPDFVVQNDFQSRMIYMNPAARRMAGVTADEDVSQRVVADFVPPWVVDRMLSEIVPSAMTSGLWVGETAVLDSGGSEVPVNHLLIVHRDSRGKVDRVSSIMRDISANKIAAKALLESQDRLRQVTDNLPALISYLDTDLRFLFANRVYQDWFGFEPDALIGRSLLEVYGERVFSIARPHMEAALAGQRISYEREASTAGGSRSLFVEVTPQFDAQNTVVGLYVLMSDITPRRRAEQALRQSEQRLRSITDRLPMRIAFVDTDERYRFANPAAALALGQTVDEMVGRSVEELFNSDHYLQLKPHIRQALAGETVSFEFESTEAEAYRCYRATYVPQRSFDGAMISGFISIIGEVTSQKLSERRLVEMSRIDSLTGLSNRSGFEAELAESIHVAAMSKVPMALMYLDIDHFKSVNDSFGHLTGDLLLKAFAGRLTKTLRGTDIVTRLGGDEFTIILPGLAQKDDAAKLAANLVLVMQPPFVLDTRAIKVTVSIGVVVYMGKDVTAAEQLIERADALLYEAKAQGRDGFRLGMV